MSLLDSLGGSGIHPSYRLLQQLDETLRSLQHLPNDVWSIVAGYADYADYDTRKYDQCHEAISSVEIPDRNTFASIILAHLVPSEQNPCSGRGFRGIPRPILRESVELQNIVSMMPDPDSADTNAFRAKLSSTYLAACHRYLLRAILPGILLNNIKLVLICRQILRRRLPPAVSEHTWVQTHVGYPIASDGGDGNGGNGGDGDRTGGASCGVLTWAYLFNYVTSFMAWDDGLSKIVNLTCCSYDIVDRKFLVHVYVVNNFY